MFDAMPFFIYLIFKDAWSRVVVEFGHLEDVHAPLEVELVPEGHETAEGGRLSAAIPLIQEKDPRVRKGELSSENAMGPKSVLSLALVRPIFEETLKPKIFNMIDTFT